MAIFSPAYSPAIGYDSIPTIANTQNGIVISQVPGGQLTAAIIGDSLTAKCNSGPTVSTTVWGNNVATITTASAHGLRQGNAIRYVGTTGSASVTLNGNWTVQSIVSTTVFTIDLTGRNVSISAGSTSTADAINDREKVSTIGFTTWANMFSGQRFNFVYNGGQGGDNTTNMLARISSEIFPYNPQLCFIMGGANDTATTATAATIFSNLTGMATLCIEKGIVPVLMTILPVGSGLASASTRQAVINQVNNSLKYYAGSNTRVIVIDTAAAITNPATGYMLATCLSADGSNIHLSKTGGRVVGQSIADAFSRNSNSYLLTASVLDNYNANTSNQNIIDNAPWVATGGTVGTGGSGTAAQGFNVLRTAGSGTFVSSAPARTVVDDGDTIGFNQTMAITSGGATDVFDARLVLGTDTATQTRMVAGGVYELRAALKLQNVQGSGLANVSVTFSMTMTDSVSGFSYSVLLRATTNDDNAALDQAYPIGAMTTADGIYTLRSYPVAIATTVTGSNGTGVRTTFQFGAAATAGNPPVIVSIGRVSIVRVA